MLIYTYYKKNLLMVGLTRIILIKSLQNAWDKNVFIYLKKKNFNL